MRRAIGMPNTIIAHAAAEVKSEIAEHYRQIARDLRHAADAMDRVADLEPGSKVSFMLVAYSYSKDDKPLAAAFCRAFAPVEKIKTYSGGDLRLVRNYSPNFEAALTVKREAVCRKVTKLQEVTAWECDPILDSEPPAVVEAVTAHSPEIMEVAS
jgi:hypothetical protein